MPRPCSTETSARRVEVVEMERFAVAARRERDAADADFWVV